MSEHKRIAKYKLITSNAKCIDEDVNAYIDLGWELYEYTYSLMVGSSLSHFQVVVKHGKDN